MIPKCLTCEFYHQEECPDCHDDSQWREDDLIRDVRKEERERIIKLIEAKLHRIADQMPRVPRLSPGHMYELYGQKYMCDALITELRGER